MIRSHQTFWNRMLMLGDFISTVLAMLLAWVVRFDLGLFPSSSHVPLGHSVIAIILIGTFVSNTLTGLYLPRRREKLTAELSRLVRSHILLGIILMSAFFAIRLSDFPRSVILIYLVSSFVLVSLFRMTGRIILRRLRSAGFNQKHIVLIGRRNSIERIRASIRSYPWMGYHVDDVFVLEESDEKRYVQSSKLREQLSDLLRDNLIDEVIIASPGRDRESLLKFISVCELHGVQTSIVPDYFDLFPSKPRVHDFGDIPAIVVRGEPLDDPFNSLAKRTFDILFASVALVVLSPFMGLIALVIKITSPGPVVFKQIRIGKGRRPFTIYKFRTMHTPEHLENLRREQRHCAENTGQEETAASVEGWTVENDPRRTKFGTFLRKTSLDETLQFWNVLRGDMSVIGPRPEQPRFVDEFRQTVPSYMVKHHVRPGITGWAQVNGWRGDTSITERIKCDLYYIENWTFTMDLKIVYLTVLKGLVNKHAY